MHKYTVEDKWLGSSTEENKPVCYGIQHELEVNGISLLKKVSYNALTGILYKAQKRVILPLLTQNSTFSFEQYTYRKAEPRNS